jgi:uncharacterized MnhB-related membrane protein
MTAVAFRIHRSPDVPITRDEWDALPATSPAKAVRPRFARAVLRAVAVVVIAATAAGSYLKLGTADAAATGAVAGSVFAWLAVVALDREMRWRSYLSLFTDQPGSR